MAPPLGYPKTKKLSASGGFAPDPPTRGSARGPRWGLRPKTPERSPSSKFATTPLIIHDVMTHKLLQLGHDV